MQIWKPFPKQEEALRRAEFEVLFGGARGPGKTDAGVIWTIGEEWTPGKFLLDHPRYRCLVIRKNADDLADWVDRVVRLHAGFGVSAAYKPTILRYPSGAIIRTGHLKDEQSYMKYQGQEFQRMLIEELTQILLERRYMQLLSSCRSTVPEIKPQVFNTANPGGPGHVWVKKRFIDPAPAMTPFTDPVSGRKRIYIPATVDDNPVLKELDPSYINFLESLKDTDEDLWKAWRKGDWDTFAGQFFRSFDRTIHVIPRYTLDRREGYLLASLDWGRKDNFAFYVHHVKPVQYDGVKFYRVITFIEAYGNNRGAKEWAKIIKDRLDGYSIKIGNLTNIMADNQIFQQSPTEDGRTIADIFYDFDDEYRGTLKAASKNRIAGWENLKDWLSMAPDGKPYWQITENCTDLIRTLPAAIHDENKVEDIDQRGEDDALDSVRYGFTALTWIDAKIDGSDRGIIEEQHSTIQEDAEAFSEEDDDERIRDILG